MEKCITKSVICGMDVHESTIKTCTAACNGAAEVKTFSNSEAGRNSLIRYLQGLVKKHGCRQVVTAYEACMLGFGLHDELSGAGMVDYVLAPSLMRKSRKDVKRKTDEADARMIFETLRGHVLAGNSLPTVWVPPPELREDREVVRARLELGNKTTKIKEQIQMLLKKHGARKPSGMGGAWTMVHRRWLHGLLTCGGPELPPGAKIVLSSLLRQLAMLEKEIKTLDEAVETLSHKPRYQVACQALVKQIKGVGLLTAMVFLTEIGDLGRFHNRRQLGSYLGLAPTSNESGETSDRKGHINRCGAGRVRWVLCQASWVRLQHDEAESAVFERIRKGTKKLTRVAQTACMRRLAVLMWHTAKDALAAA